MKRRRKIHTEAKISEYLGILPQSYREQLHPSQLSRYRRSIPSDYFGHDLTDLLTREIERIRKYEDFPAAKKISDAILKLFIFFRCAVAKARGLKTALYQNRFFFVELTQRFRDIIPVRKFSRMIGVSESTLRQWIRQIRVKCSDSVINICRRVHPNQLLSMEINKMKILLSDDEYRYWPLSSLYYFALKNKIVAMSLSSWYKYSILLNVRRLKPKTLKIKTTGIRASCPNELWHADVTYFYTSTRERFYIYTVIDNFSRFPLCVMVSDKLCGKFRTHTFREALKKAIWLNPSVENLKLMTDGGTENFNHNVTDFLNNTEAIKIKHIKALNDGWPSNSMAEAFNYVLKIFYLNHMDIRNLTDLSNELALAVEDYAYKRPHNTLKGLTPYQVYTGQRPENVSFTPQLQNARNTRIATNKTHICVGKCSFK